MKKEVHRFGSWVMHRLVPPIAIAIMSAGLLTANNVTAQEFPSYAPRCLTQELNEGMEQREFCERPFAAFGLSGPTMTPHSDAFDVVATGSIKGARDAVHDNQGVSK
jgi:hypothetical protein